MSVQSYCSVIKYHPVAPHMLLFYNNSLSTVSTLMSSATTILQNQLSSVRLVSLLYLQCINHFLFWGIYTCFHFSVCSFSIYPSNSGSHFQFLLSCHLCNEFCSDLLDEITLYSSIPATLFLHFWQHLSLVEIQYIFVTICIFLCVSREHGCCLSGCLFLIAGTPIF